VLYVFYWFCTEQVSTKVINNYHITENNQRAFRIKNENTAIIKRLNSEL